MKPLIFLDVDGVLNRCEYTPSMCRGLQDDLVVNLVGIVRATEAGIVVSSTWRLYPHLLHRLRDRLLESHIKIIGQTPELVESTKSGLFTAKERGVEIQHWLDDQLTKPRSPLSLAFDLKRFVILDDGSDMAHLKDHLVQTDSFTGLTPEKATEAIKLLNP